LGDLRNTIILNDPIYKVIQGILPGSGSTQVNSVARTKSHGFSCNYQQNIYLISSQCLDFCS